MIITPIKTYRVHHDYDLEKVLADSLPPLTENTVVAVTSKIISLCEGNYVLRKGADKAKLIHQEAGHYAPSLDASEKGGKTHTISITKGILVPAAGIDSSKNFYILWPKDPQKTANRIRSFLSTHFKVKNVGVVITDSTSRLLRKGVTGIVLAHSGFKALTGTQRYQKDVAGGLAAGAVLAMGEGAESTPLAVITDMPFVEFQSTDPSTEELTEIQTTFETDLFRPLFESVAWVKGLSDSSIRGSK